MQTCKLLCLIFRSSLQTSLTLCNVFIQRLQFSLCICVLMDEMLVSKGCSSTTVSTEHSFYPPSPLYPLWPCNPMRWMQIDWPITHTHLCRQGSPLNPWDSVTCEFVYVRAHGLTPAARLDMLNTATNRQTKVCIIAHSADSFPAFFFPWRNLTDSFNTTENKPPSTLMSVCATYLQSKCNSVHFEAKVKGLIAGIRRA